MQKSHKDTKSTTEKRPRTRASEKKIRRLLESITDMIFETDIDGNVTYTNKMTLRTLGYTQRNLHRINILDSIAPDEIDMMKSSMNKLINAQHIAVEPALEDYTFLRADGSKIPLTTHLNSILDDTGQVVGFRGILFNINNRQFYNADLQMSKERLRFIFDAISDGIIITDLEGKVVEVNNATLQKAGYTRKQEIIGQNAFEFIAQKDQQRFQQDILDTIAKRDVQDRVEYTLWAVDGKKFDAEISAALLRDSEGNPTGFIGVIRDVTSRKKIETNLKSSQERLQTIVENAPDAIFIYDNEGNIIYGNRKAEELTGYSKIEFMGKNVFDIGIVTEEYVPLVLERLKHFRGIPSGPQEVELINKAGRRIFIEVTVFPIAKPGISEVVGIARDITERKRMENELDQYRHHLETLIEQRTIELASTKEKLQKEINNLRKIGKSSPYPNKTQDL